MDGLIKEKGMLQTLAEIAGVLGGLVFLIGVMGAVRRFTKDRWDRTQIRTDFPMILPNHVTDEEWAREFERLAAENTIIKRLARFLGLH